MTREFFNKQFAALVVSFPMAQRMPDETADVYFEMLQGIPEEKFVAGVKHCLAVCRFFPTIAEIGESCLPAVMVPGPRVMTKNGWDTPLIAVSWDRQLERQEGEARKINRQALKLLG